MAFPITGTPYPPGSANPAPPYSGTFIPEIWSGRLLEKFYDASVVPAIANTNWEGEIKNQGDKVIIRTRPNITIREYEANGEIQVERPSSNVVELLIDKGFYWATILDDVMEVQADIDQMNIWAEDASEQMKISVDTEVLAYIPSEVDADNQGDSAGRISQNVNLGTAAAPLQLTRDNTSGTDVLEVAVRFGQVLDEQNIPETGRWMVIPAWMAALFKISDLRKANEMGDGTSVLRNGRLGMLDRFEIYVSNLLPTVTDATAGDSTVILAGHSHGLTFASQVSKTETIRAERTFGNIMRGLKVYGRKVVDGRSLAMAVAQRG